MISDFVKGKKKFDYPEKVQAGISLHRIIDTFTDNHPATKEAKEIFKADYRLYSGAFVDVVYDHFLANDHESFNNQSLFNFSEKVYTDLANYAHLFPDNFGQMFPFMRSQNWLFNYRLLTGTEKSMNGLVRRSAYLTEANTAYHLFKTNYQRLNNCYRQFWADMLPFAKNQYEALL